MLARCSKCDFRNLGEIPHRNRYPNFFHRKFFSSKKNQTHFGRKKKLVEKYFLGSIFLLKKNWSTFFSGEIIFRPKKTGTFFVFFSTPAKHLRHKRLERAVKLVEPILGLLAAVSGARCNRWHWRACLSLCANTVSRVADRVAQIHKMQSSQRSLNFKDRFVTNVT